MMGVWRATLNHKKGPGYIKHVLYIYLISQMLLDLHIFYLYTSFQSVRLTVVTLGQPI